jgi:hypothetical protein
MYGSTPHNVRRRTVFTGLPTICNRPSFERYVPSHDLAREIQELCRLIVGTEDEALLMQLCERLRNRLHEHNRQTNDMASETLARILDAEALQRKVS